MACMPLDSRSCEQRYSTDLHIPIRKLIPTSLNYSLTRDQRPDLVAPILTVYNQTREKQAPGYYFAAPYQQIQESIHIYDNDAVR